MQTTMFDPAPLPQVGHRLAAYLPATLAQQILEGGLPPPGSARTVVAATLFSDISGFTRMAEELATDGPRGAEELNRVLLLTFTAMINVIHDAGGSVCHFHGDAMMVYFPEEKIEAAHPADGGAAPAALQALACAQLMQRLMATTFGRVVVNRPPHKDPVFYLTMKIGVAYGRCVEVVVGDPATALEFVLAGPAVDEAAAAQQRAGPGQVVAAPSLLARAGLPSGDVMAVKEKLPSLNLRPFTEWKNLEQTALQRLVETGLLFVPSSLRERLHMMHHDFVAEHRPVTSLFVQFDGIDFEAANAGNLLQLYYEWTSQIVARFGLDNGRLNRILTGDKGNQLHIFFGAPLAPDAPEQAVRCALALQRAKPAFITSQKIGVAAGKVFACPVGSQERREYTIVGDVVNLSAHLTQMCPDGAVLVSEATAARIEQFIELKPQAAVTLKGRQEPVTVFQAVGEQSATAQLKGYFSRWQRPLVGREKELDLLLGGLDAALHGAGGMAAISGPVGVGKTRLLAAGVEYWLQVGGQGVLGLCHPHTADVPYAPWLHVWHDFFGLQPQMNVQAQAEAVVQRTRELVPDCGDDVALWGEILALPLAGGGETFHLPAEVRRARFLRLAQRCVLAAAAQRPLLFVLEDLHWADRATLALIDQIAALASGRPIFLALTYRPSPELPLAALQRPFCTPLILADLPVEVAYRFVCSYIGETDLPPLLEQHLGLLDRDGRSSAINPLFLEESLKVMLDTGVLEKHGRWRVNEQRLAEMQVPDTIHGLLLARLDRLPTGSRDLLQVASVIGRQFGLETLTRITEDTPRDLIVSLLSDLSEAELTRLITTDPELTYLFQHAMTRDVAYESLPYSRRQALHAAIADWLVDRYGDNLKPFYALLAYHYGQTDLHEKGLRYALAAAGEAKAIYANSDALELYCLARAHLEALGEKAHWQTAVDLCLASGEVLRELGNFGTASEHLEHALALAEKNGDTDRMACSCNLLAEIRYRQSRFDEAIALAARVIDGLAPDVAPAQLARALHWSGMAAAALLEFVTALERLRLAEQLAVRIHDNERLARVLEAIAYVHYSQQQLPEALAVMERGVQLTRQYSPPANVGFALSNIALIQFNLGRPTEALDTLNEAVTVARTTVRNLLGLTLMNRAEVLAYLGHFAKALGDFEEALDLSVLMDDEYSLLMLYLLWAWEYDLPLQQWTSAGAHLQGAQEILQRQPDPLPEEMVRALIGLGRVLAADGKYAEAGHSYQEANRLIEDKDLCWWKPALYYFDGLLKVAQADRLGANSLFQKAASATAEHGCLDYLCVSLLEQARLESTNGHRERLLEQCIEAARRRARHLDRITCLKEAGEMLLRSRQIRRRILGGEALQLAAQLENTR
jgi:class 3 adenylate cyclase/tetratricopeptide (TPR) repeat protein